MPADIVGPKNNKKTIQKYALRAIKKDWKDIHSDIDSLFSRLKDVELAGNRKLASLKKRLEDLDKELKKIK
jgi:hypothetical protein